MDAADRTDRIYEEEEGTERAVAKTKAQPIRADILGHLKDPLLKKARSIREQRDVIRGRIQKIEASHGKVGENVYQKVAADYLQRLDETRQSMIAIKGEIDGELIHLYDKERDAAQRLQAHEETLEEAEFRYELGEYPQEEYERIADGEQKLLDGVKKEQGTLQAAIGQYEEIFAGEDLGEMVPAELQVNEAEEEEEEESAPIPMLRREAVPAPQVDVKPPPQPTAPRQSSVASPQRSESPSVGHGAPRVVSRDGLEVRPVTPLEIPKTKMVPTTAKLLVKEGAQSVGEYTVEGELHIGRSPTNEVALRETKVSRRHATIRHQVDGFYVIDNQSSNGTFVNGKRITEHLLQPGDQIQIGSYELEFKPD